MSKMFGLDWKNYEVGRINEILYIQGLVAEKEKEASRQSKMK